LVLPDGVGLKIISWIFGGKIKENCNGTDFSPKLMEEAAKEGYKIFLLGSKDGIAQKASENIKKTIPNLKIVGTSSGYFNNDEEVIQKINTSGADILFVAMGVPLQEKWIARNRDRLNPKLCLGVGALFDYLSGSTPRAPLPMRRMHLEWLWRIFIEPKRMFKRYIIDGSKLFWIVMKYKIGSK
jgi:N-acetylglucosaminyldiphosphoundecaprenol N-acetyl-beta-D-mannosaminyltransferase